MQTSAGFESLAALWEEIAARIADLAKGESPPGTPLDTAGSPTLTDLAEKFDLGPIAVGLVAVGAAAMVDGRFGALFAGLDKGRSRTRPRLGHALQLAGGRLSDHRHRELLLPGSGPRRAGLIEVLDETDPFPDRVLAVPDRVIGHLLGSGAAESSLLPLLVAATPIDHPVALDVARVVASGRWLVWLRDSDGAGRSTAATALGLLELPAVVLDLDKLGEQQSLVDVLPPALLEAGLVGGGVVIGPVDPRRDREALRRLVAPPGRPVILVSARHWDPAISGAGPVLLEAPALDATLRRPAWVTLATDLGLSDVDVVADEMALLRVPPDRAAAVGAAAAGLAAAHDDELGVRQLRAAALAEGAGRLDTLAHHVVPTATFDDLVLPPDITAELRSVASRYRTRHVVRGDWRLDRHSRRGVTCLFAGASGTGKTLAAEVIAGDLGVDLFVIDLSQIVDKYIGETEKNLEKVFTEAERLNGVLLFDEADALFGKRGAVNSSNDRHANVEVAYLLQRMERHDGIAILTTNLRNNLDEAFTRRLDVICAFPDPGRTERLALWQRHLPPSVPQAADVDLDALARAMTVTGGVIRNITLTAAHTAAEQGKAVDQSMLIAAARREHAKMGRLFADL